MRWSSSAWSEVALVLALFATGLRTHPALVWRRWRPTVRLLCVGLPLTVLAGAALGTALVGLPLAADHAGRGARADRPGAGRRHRCRPARQRGGRGARPSPRRFTLTTEAGLNDGFAYPLFLIGALVATEGGGRLAGPLGGGGSDLWSPTVDDGPTDDGQANEALIHDRDRRLGVSTADKRQKRADIPNPKVLLGANSWESGRTVQTRLEEMDVKR